MASPSSEVEKLPFLVASSIHGFAAFAAVASCCKLAIAVFKSFEASQAIHGLSKALLQLIPMFGLDFFLPFQKYYL